MKHTKKALVLIFFTILVVISAGAIYASSSPTQTTQGTIEFKAPNGIRWNSSTGVFEVFNTAGVSHIASNFWVSTTGEVNELSKPSESYALADGNQKYHIMQDISYEESLAFNANYNTQGITLQALGVIDGRGFYLHKFPISTALITKNNGTIRNLNIEGFTKKADASNSLALLVNENHGTIENCVAYGTISNISTVEKMGVFSIENYGTIQNCVNNFSILDFSSTILGGISATSEQGSVIKNCINNADIDSDTGRIFAGIVADGAGEIINCKNNGKIRSLYASVGIVAGDGAITIKDSVNNGNIESNFTSGIFYKDTENSNVLTISGNINNGNLTAVSASSSITLCSSLKQITSNIKAENINKGEQSGNIIFHLYSGVYDLPPSFTGRYGIVYNPSRNAFEVNNATGLSYIASDIYFLSDGSKAQGVSTIQASADAKYYIMNDIDYSDLVVGLADENFLNNEAINLEANGVIDGQGHMLKGLPVRQAIYEHSSEKLSTAFINLNYGTIKNLNFSDFDYTYYSIGNIDGVSAGLVTAINYGIIENCSAYGQIDFASATISSSYFSVFSAISYEIIENCVNNIAITNNVSSSLYISGIASNMYGGLIKACVNNGNIESICRAGGIVQYAKNEVSIFDCINNADLKVTATQSYSAGIVSRCSTSSYLIIKNCQNRGKITGLVYVAGIIGDSYDTLAFDCINYGEISGASFVAGISASSYLVTKATSFNSCYNYGTVNSDEDCAGILANGGGGLVINNCYNFADISGFIFVGGIGNDAGGTTIINCVNTGNITGSENVGGIAGIGDVIKYCVNTGKITGSVSIGGIAGIIQTAVIDCFDFSV